MAEVALDIAATPKKYYLTVHLSPNTYEWAGGDWEFGLEHIDESTDVGAAGKPISAEVAARHLFNPAPPVGWQVQQAPI